MNSQTGKQLGWKWFKFIIYAQLFLCALLDAGQAVMLFTGTHYGGGSEGAALVYGLFKNLKALDVVMGICLLVLAGMSIVIRQKLAHFEKVGTKWYLMLQIATLGVNILYAVALYGLVYAEVQELAGDLMPTLWSKVGSSVTSSIFWLVVNKIYFDNRKEYFVQGGVSNPAQYLLDLSNGTAQPPQSQPPVQPQPFVQQPAMQQGTVMQQQPTMQQDTVMQQQPTMQQDTVMQQQPTMQQDTVMQQQPTMQQDPTIQQQPTIQQESKVSLQKPAQPQQPQQPQQSEQPQVQEHGVLICLKGLYAGAEIPMNDGDEITLGRAETNNLVFATEPRISREHCKIRWDAQKQKYIFRDYSSSGSYIDGSEDCLPQNLDLEVACGSEIALGNQDNVFLLK